MPDAKVNLIKGDTHGADSDYRDALPVNMTAVSRQILGADGYMISHEGLTKFADVVGVDRGGIWNERQKRHYRVSGGSLISVDQDGGIFDIGGISGSKRVSLAYSFNTQSIVADGKWWLYNGDELKQVIDSDLGSPIDHTWVDNYYFFTDGETLYHTEIGDEYSIAPLDFATSEFSPDPTLAVDRTSSNEVIVFNRYSIEYFINRATDNFAFQRLSSKAIKCGPVGTHAETELEGVFFIVGSGKEESVSVHMISPGRYTSVATREVDKILGLYNEQELADTILETRVEDRDKFLIVQLPKHTLIFNKTIADRFGVEQAWTILKTEIMGQDAWRGVNGVFDPRVSKWIYGDKIEPILGELDDSVSSQYGEQQEQLLYTPFIKIEGGSIDEIEIESIPGIQLSLDDVTVSASLTYDGVTYGREWFNLYGQKNNYGTRFIVRRLGYVREFVGLKLRSVTTSRIVFASMSMVFS